MSDVLDARAKLREQAEELDKYSKALAFVCRELEPVEAEYQRFVDDFELGLLLRSENEDGYRLPSAALRLKMAHQAMKPELLGRHIGLTNKRTRLQQRIRDLKAQVDAQRSLVSAYRAEMEATT